MLVDRRDDGLGIVVEQRNDLLRRRGVGDARVIAQIAEPQDRVDPVGDAPLDAASQHPPARVASEIGLDQRLGDASERGRFDRKPEEGREPLQRAELIVAKAFSSIRRPIGIHTIHLADHAVFGEAVDDRDIVRELRLAKLREGREFGFGLRGHTQAQQRIRRWSRAGREGSSATVPPPPLRSCGHIRSASPPAFRAPSGTRAPREWGGACRRAPSRGERQSASDRAAAKALDERGFGPSLKPRFREPGRELGDLGFGHGRIIKGRDGRPNALRLAAAGPYRSRARSGPSALIGASSLRAGFPVDKSTNLLDLAGPHLEETHVPSPQRDCARLHR